MLAKFCVILSIIIVLGSGQVDLKTCGDRESTVTCPFFFNKIDAAFRQRNALYTLRKAFFPTEGAPPFLFDVEMSLNVERIPNVDCDDEEYAFRDDLITSPPSESEVCDLLYECRPLDPRPNWKHQWSKTIVSYIIEREDLELLQDTNFIAYAAAAFNNFDTSVFSQESLELDGDNSTNSSGLSRSNMAARSVQFHLIIPFLPCRPDDEVLLRAWEDVLPWLQLYAINSDNLENVAYTQEARGFAFRELSRNTPRRGLTIPLLTVIHILLNIVFASGATYMAHKYHRNLNTLKGKQYQLVASMYWSVVFMCLIGAVVVSAGNVYLYYALIFIEDKSISVLIFRILGDGTIALIVILELIVSILTPRNPKFFIPHLIRRTLCCNQCCHCCGSKTRLNFIRRIILGIAMWVIIFFLQLVIASILPLMTVLVVNPVPSLAFISIMTALFFCFVIFLAYFMNAFEGNYISRHRLSTDERRKSIITFDTLRKDFSIAATLTREKIVLVIQAFIFLVIFVVVSLMIILYLNFVKAGAETNSAGGLFISLIPSAILGGITWLAKKHLFKELEEDIEAEKEKDRDENDESKGVFEIGGISINPKAFIRRSTRNKNRRIEVTNNSASKSQQVDVAIDMDEHMNDTHIEENGGETEQQAVEEKERAGRNDIFSASVGEEDHVPASTHKSYLRNSSTKKKKQMNGEQGRPSTSSVTQLLGGEEDNTGEFVMGNFVVEVDAPAIHTITVVGGEEVDDDAI